MSKCFISYRHVKPDEDLARFLEKHLIKHEHKVFLDTQIEVGTKWVDEIERQIRDSGFFIVLLSKESIRSDMVRQEVKLAHELSKIPGQSFTILPVRVAFAGELPYDLGSYLDLIQYALWEPTVTFEIIGEQILSAIEKSTALPNQGKSDKKDVSESGIRVLADATEKAGAPLPAADPRLTGTVRLDSPFYIRRKADTELEDQVQLQGTTTVIKGPRQMGKSSLLARVNAVAKINKQKALYLDFQLIDEQQLESLESLMHYIAWELCIALETRIEPDECWKKALGAKRNLTIFIEKAILSENSILAVILFDEADRVFNYPYRDDFFATVRGWHNLRATKEIWNNFNLMIAHSTEPNLWIQDIHQSPFNVGYRIRLDEFNADQVSELNAKHGAPLKEDREIKDLMELVGGHPYLVRQAFYTLVSNDWAMSELKKVATDEQGPFGDHLRQYQWRLQKNKPLKDALRQIIYERECDDESDFQRLSAAGLVKGEDRKSVEIRCALYKEYFKKHL